MLRSVPYGRLYYHLQSASRPPMASPSILDDPESPSVRVVADRVTGGANSAPHEVGELPRDYCHAARAILTAASARQRRSRNDRPRMSAPKTIAYAPINDTSDSAPAPGTSIVTTPQTIDRTPLQASQGPPLNPRRRPQSVDHLQPAGPDR